MAGFQATNREMEIAGELARRRTHKERLGMLVSAIDELLFSLEELNLQGVDRVPAPLRDRAAGIIQLIKPTPPREGVDERIRVRYRVVLMMDVLFELQERVLRERNPTRIAGEGKDLVEIA